MNKAVISKEICDSLIESHNKNKYDNHICNVKCRLGGEKQFKVKDTNITVTMRCTQHGGMWGGNYCYIYVSHFEK